MKRIKVGVLVSGRGTNLQSIIDHSESGKIDADVAVVISDRMDAYALERAKKHGIPAYFVDPKEKSRKEHEEEIDKILREHNVDLVVGAGYMRVLSSWFIKRWYGRIINIHPALLPSFKGTDGQGDALKYGVKITGCTTHFMDEEIDHGPIILQAAVKVKDDDTRESLAERILRVEHQLLPRTIQLFAEGRLKIEGRKVRILPGDSWKDEYEVYPDVLYCEGY